MRVLYVEDDRLNALLFEEALTLAQDFDCRVAERGDEALALVRDWTPDVLVLDAHLPDTNGFALLGALRAVPGLAGTPAFMCSADASDDQVRQATEAGFLALWSKPVRLPQLLADLRAVRPGGGAA